MRKMVNKMYNIYKWVPKRSSVSQWNLCVVQEELDGKIWDIYKTAVLASAFLLIRIHFQIILLNFFFSHQLKKDFVSHTSKIYMNHIWTSYPDFEVANEMSAAWRELAEGMRVIFLFFAAVGRTEFRLPYQINWRAAFFPPLLPLQKRFWLTRGSSAHACYWWENYLE